MAANGTESRSNELEILTQTTVLVPALMTLICFICTVMSITVAGFICFRDKEAKEESERLSKQQKSDEFVAKTLSIFYKIRTYNVFRVREIVDDKNEDRPVWYASKQDVILNLEDLGIFLSDREKRGIEPTSELHELDAESLLYFELERYAKAVTMHGSNAVEYFDCIQQDGIAFPRDYFPDTRPVFERDLICSLYKEMQEVTELFVVLLTAIELQMIQPNNLPGQFKLCQLVEELSPLEEYLYNYYLRAYPRDKIDRTLPFIPKRPPPPLAPSKSSWEPENIGPSQTPTKGQLPIEQKPYESQSLATHSYPYENIPISPSEMGSITNLTEAASYTKKRRAATRFRRYAMAASSALKLGRKGKIERAQSRASVLEEEPEDIYGQSTYDETLRDRRTSLRSLRPYRSQQDILEPSPMESGYLPSITVEESSPPEVARPKQELTKQKSVPREKPKLVRKAGSNRRRGRLKESVLLEHNSFTYMITRVIECLKGNTLTPELLTTKTFMRVDRNFIV